MWLFRTVAGRAVPWFREVAHPSFLSRHSRQRLFRHHGLNVERLVRVHAGWLHRQDWIAVARK